MKNKLSKIKKANLNLSLGEADIPINEQLSWRNS